MAADREARRAVSGNLLSLTREYTVKTPDIFGRTEAARGRKSLANVSVQCQKQTPESSVGDLGRALPPSLFLFYTCSADLV